MVMFSILTCLISGIHVLPTFCGIDRTAPHFSQNLKKFFLIVRITTRSINFYKISTLFTLTQRKQGVQYSTYFIDRRHDFDWKTSRRISLILFYPTEKLQAVTKCTATSRFIKNILPFKNQVTV